MNISGFQYSKATAGLRQRNKITDQQFKLIFIYPLLCDKAMSKNLDILRDFISTSMLKEIFTSNTLNIIQTASAIHPLVDERGNNVDQSNIISKAKFSSNDNSFYFNNSQPINTNESYKRELQNRINTKTVTIQKLLDTDPRFKNLRPFIEMITMGNMIDIPVIVGTKSFDVDTATMTFIILIAISQKLSLSNREDIDTIFTLLKNTKPEDAWKLLNNILNSKPDKEQSRISKWFETKWDLIINDADSFFKGNRYTSHIYTHVKPYAKTAIDNSINLIKKGVTPTPKQNLKKYDEIPLNSTFALMKAIQNNISQAEISFKFAIDPNLRKRQLGFDLSPGQTINALNSDNGLKNLTVEVKALADNLYLGFNKDFSTYGHLIIDSFINLLYPVGNINADVSRDEIFINNSTEMLQSFHNIISTQLMPCINSNLSKLKPSQADVRIKLLKDLCKNSFPDIQHMFKLFSQELTQTNINPGFTIEQFRAYINTLNALTPKAAAQITSVELALSKLITSADIKSLTATVASAISRPIGSISKSLLTYDPQHIASSETITNGTSLDSKKKIYDFTSELIASTSTYIELMFWYNVIISLCQYVNTVETTIETSVSDVTDDLNYTLVLPLETIMAVAHAFEAKSYRDMLNNLSWSEQNPKDQNFDKLKNGGKTDHLKLFGALNDNYIKGVIKFIIMKLDVPNVIIIDSVSNKVYYRLMYMTDVQQASFSTLDAFIQLTTKQELTQNSNSW